MQVKQVNRSFIVGSEWLYYKIYCGVSVANDVLLNAISPLTIELLEKKLIKSWFFIRYNDPEPHLRVRFLVTNNEDLGGIIRLINKQLEYYLNYLLVWDLQLHTYHREIERYGNNTIELSEQLFYFDSVNTIKAIEYNNDESYLIAYALYSIKALLNCALLDINQQLQFAEIQREGFKKEFHANKQTTKQFNSKYKTFKRDLSIKDGIYKDVLKTYINTIKPIFETIKGYNKQNILEITIEQYIASIIHMKINRLFKSKQRLYEYLLYDFLLKELKTEKFILK